MVGKAESALAGLHRAADGPKRAERSPAYIVSFTRRKQKQ